MYVITRTQFQDSKHCNSWWRRQIHGRLSNLIFILANKLDKKSKIRNLFEKDNELICIPCYEDNAISLNKIVNLEIKKSDIKISQESINLLIDRSSGDRQNLKNELEKIKSYAYKKKVINIKGVSPKKIVNINYLIVILCIILFPLKGVAWWSIDLLSQIASWFFSQGSENWNFFLIWWLNKYFFNFSWFFIFEPKLTKCPGLQ